MKKLEDITYRHELIERYLDADTSVEEEQALADFYRHCEDKDLTDEDLDIRNLMLGMENYTPNFHQTEMEMMEELDGKEEMKELDRKEGADGQPQMKEMSLATSKNHETIQEREEEYYEKKTFSIRTRGSSWSKHRRHISSVGGR
jgi:hypothetical protein